MKALLEFAHAHQAEIVGLTRRFVECESPSGDRTAVNKMTDLIADVLRNFGTIRILDGGKYGKHLRCEFTLPGSKRDGQIVILGHSDTVWPIGTLACMPFRHADGRLWGPGVLDMKSGLAFLVFAIRALIELDRQVNRRVFLQVNSDEEIGSPSSRPLTEEIAINSAAALVLEFGTGLDGKVKTSRKGVAVYTIVVKGQESHAGVDFENGASAIIEIAKQIGRISRFNNIARGTTVNVGLISGGALSNIVAGEARMEVDVRVARMNEAAALHRRFLALRPFDKRCSLYVDGGLRRPPMVRSAGIETLFREAQFLAQQIDIPLEESATGGTSDGNFTAALGVPTLDGLGGVGEGAHASNESILEDRIADRVALLAGLIEAV
jgi:glutamate carboxypeptidase